nr:transposase family protein [Streptomyces sp. SID5476]
MANVLVVSIDVSDAAVTVRARTRSGVPAECPGCGEPSAWIHSRYIRRLADITLGGRPLHIHLSVRRLYCENPACPKVTFTEQVAGLTVRYQRRTPELQRLVEAVGVVLAGRGGSRMLRILNVTLSRCTVLSQLMRMPLPPLETPSCWGWTTSRSTATPTAPSWSTPPPGSRSPSGKVATRTAQPVAPRSPRCRGGLPRRLAHLPAGHHRWCP